MKRGIYNNRLCLEIWSGSRQKGFCSLAGKSNYSRLQRNSVVQPVRTPATHPHTIRGAGSSMAMRPCMLLRYRVGCIYNDDYSYNTMAAWWRRQNNNDGGRCCSRFNSHNTTGRNEAPSWRRKQTKSAWWRLRRLGLAFRSSVKWGTRNKETGDAGSKGAITAVTTAATTSLAPTTGQVKKAIN